MEAETWADSRVKCPAHWSPAFWPPRELESPNGEAGRSVLAEATLAWEQAVFSVAGNTIEVLLRLRERLQSALQEQGAEAPAFGRLFIFGSRQKCGGAGQDQG